MRRRAILSGLAGGLAGCVSNQLELVSVSGGTIDDDPRWMDRAPLASPFRVKIAFLLRDKVYTDTSGPSAKDWTSRPITLPDFPRREPLAAETRELEGNLPALADYYRQGPKLIVPTQRDTFFWLRLTVGGGTPETTIGFSWWDTLSEFRPFLDWMAKAKDGDTFDDLDQGWRVQAARRGRELFFRHSDWEEGEELGTVRAPVDLCVAEANDTMARAERIVDALKGELRIDPWS
jgi:hypothetical protein